jgi:NAD(P)-dependent dehydrogenase (short-subunit alcohol dehydrogenase family)
MASPIKRIVVTGVSRGLGRAMVEGFLARGHVVLGCARSKEAIQELRRSHPSPAAFHAVDIRRDAQVRVWAQRVMESGGPPDLLVNNAGLINRNAPLWRVADKEFSDVMDVNVRGTVNVLRWFLPAMIERGQGVVVNFSSGWGRSASAEVAPYCASKWAIEGMTQALSQELPEGLAAVALNPGIIDTDMLRSCFGANASSFPDATAWAERAVPFLLGLGPKDNGHSATVPGVPVESE